MKYLIIVLELLKFITVTVINDSSLSYKYIFKNKGHFRFLFNTKIKLLKMLFSIKVNRIRMKIHIERDHSALG